MSKLTETKRAYDQLTFLLDQELRKRSGSTADLERFRETLDVAFYLLAWGQFEYLVRVQAEQLIDGHAAAKQVEGHAWRFMQENIKSVSVRKRLDLIFHSDQRVRDSLDGDYTVRNEAAHNYKQLPKEVRKDLSGWIDELEGLISKF